MRTSSHAARRAPPDHAALSAFRWRILLRTHCQSMRGVRSADDDNMLAWALSIGTTSEASSAGAKSYTDNSGWITLSP